MVVAAQHQNAAVGIGSGSVGVPDDVAAAVDTGGFAIPDTEYAVVLWIGPQIDLLGAPNCRRRQILVDARLKDNLLFFEKPFRLRVQGEATVSDDDPLMSHFKEAQLIVRVSVNQLFPNCPRYVQRYQKNQASRYVPRQDAETPFAGWKRIDIIQEDLPAKDQGRADKAGGTMPIEEWFAKAAQGDPDA